LFVCLGAGPVNAQSLTLYWNGDGRPSIGGYKVTIDGATVDHGQAPLATDGTCGCSIPIGLNGGVHTIVVTAYNPSGQASSAPLNVAPAANPGGPYSGQAGTAIAVDGSNSSAPTGTLTNYSWRWGDGTADTSSSLSGASHTYSSNGTYTITLTVRDNAGATASASTTATINATSTLPSPWQTQDVGSVGLAGSASHASGVFTVTGAGSDVWGTADSFQFVYRTLSGDGQIVARVTGLQNTHHAAKAGVMIRESLNADAAHAMVNAIPNGGIEMLSRTTTGGNTAALSTTQPLPAWVRLARSGNTIVGSVSANGTSWSVVGSASVTMGANAFVGLAVTSHDITLLNTASFDNVSVTTGSPTQPPAMPSSPTPADGATGVSTAASLVWSAVGATSYDVAFGTANPPPPVASGLTTATFRPTSMSQGTRYYWSVTARNSAGTTPGPVWSFVTTQSDGGGVPSPWVSQDIGEVGLAGSASFAAGPSGSGGTFTVRGSGADIWGTADAFQFVHRPMGTFTEIVARVVNLQNTNLHAKAGIMIRAGFGAPSAHAMINVRPDGTVIFLSRESRFSATLSASNVRQSPPTWLKLVRAGSVVTGYVSSNGLSWMQVGSAFVNLGTEPNAGLAVTSHDTSLLNTATFDSVSLGTGSAPVPPSPNGDVVIYASDVADSSRFGAWQTAGDSRSPGGVKLTTPDSGFEANAALPSPQHYFDVNFLADANRTYRIWLRLRARSNLGPNDSVWVQFSDTLVGGTPAYRMNTTSGLAVNLATDESGASLRDWGWANSAYWLSQDTAVTFATGGLHTLRVQVRQDGVEVDQIVLSPGEFMNSAPGPPTNDLTIVER
jgi:PKD repeat protein